MEPPPVTYEQLEYITGGFSKENRIGWGSYGEVYLGTMPNGYKVAVKKFHDSIPARDDANFKTEFDNLKRVNHPHIVKIVGYCYEEKRLKELYKGRLVDVYKIHRVLCFEYLPKGSLDRYLSDYLPNLDWHTSYKIIKGIFEAVKYIHLELGEAFYHLDIKPGNILLDDEVGAKLADFGLSKVFHDRLTRTTGSSYGTPGYRPPEFIDRHHISGKFDVFSTGVVILQLVTGLKGYHEIDGTPHKEFIDKVQQTWRGILGRKYKDSLLEAYCKQVKKCVEIGLECVEKERNNRPEIQDIIHRLTETEKCISKPDKTVRWGKGPVATNMSSRVNGQRSNDIVLYTTTLGARRELCKRCNNIRQALQVLNIKFEERDLFDRNDHQNQLKKLSKSQAQLPVLLINGDCIADGPQLQELCDQGKLDVLFE